MNICLKLMPQAVQELGSHQVLNIKEVFNLLYDIVDRLCSCHLKDPLQAGIGVSLQT